jgi:hypothetical protein
LTTISTGPNRRFDQPDELGFTGSAAGFGALGGPGSVKKRGEIMSKLALALLITALSGVPVGYVFYKAALSHDNWIFEGPRFQDNWKDGGPHPAPAPIAGAGLPLLIVIGGGIWAYRRLSRRPT